jgi:hypothetical protein
LSFKKAPLHINGVPHTAITLQRTGFKLALGYAYTDHFCQGASFPLGQPWLIHLNPPPPPAADWDSKGILVTCTRNPAWGDIHMLSALYTNATERAAVIKRFYQAFKRTPEEEADLERLQALERQTLTSKWGPLAGRYIMAAGTPNAPQPHAMQHTQPLDTSATPQSIARLVEAYEAANNVWEGMP